MSAGTTTISKQFLDIRQRATSDAASSRSTGLALSSTGWMIMAVAAALVMVIDAIPDIRICVISLMTAFLLSFIGCRVTSISPLSRLMLLLYTAPFFACIGYLFERQFVWWASPAAIAFCRDELINGLMVWTALIGLLGITAGMRFGSIFVPRMNRPDPQLRTNLAIETYSTLPALTFLSVLMAITFLSWIAAPAETILSAQYGFGQTLAAAAEMGFDGASLLSLIMLGSLFVDARHDREVARKRGKTLALTVVTAYVIIFLQLMRGDRGCAGLIIAASVMYIIHSNRSFEHWWQQRNAAVVRTIKVSVPLGIAALSFLLLGFLRFMLSDGQFTTEEILQIQRDVILDNTWTSVALNNLGLAVEQSSSAMPLLKGQTYTDYFLSLPPGFVARAIGLIRPVDVGADPRFWYEGLSTGGMHPAIVPYKNFGAFGVAGLLFLCGALIGYIEAISERKGKFDEITYIGFFCFAFEWFWYGDMNLIRGIMAVAFSCILIALGSHRYPLGSFQPNRP